MQSLRPFGTAILIAVISLGLVLGGLSLALSETYTPAPATQTLELASAPAAGGFTQTPLILPPLNQSPAPTATPGSPTACPVPAGWVGVVVGPGDTLESLALRYGTSAQTLMQANCLAGTTLMAGAIVYVPPAAPSSPSPIATLYVVSPYPTRTLIPCGAPYGWVRYTVQPGDTLYHIATSYGITTSELQSANCLGSSTTIRIGQLLWVPYLPTRTPTYGPPLFTPTFEPTQPFTETVLPLTDTPEPKGTDLPTQPPTSP